MVFFTISVVSGVRGLLRVHFDCRKQIMKGSQCLVIFPRLKKQLCSFNCSLLTSLPKRWKKCLCQHFLIHIPKSVKMFTVLLLLLLLTNTHSAAIHEKPHNTNMLILLYSGCYWFSIRPQLGPKGIIILVDSELNVHSAGVNSKSCLMSWKLKTYSHNNRHCNIYVRVVIFTIQMFSWILLW